MRTDLLLDPEHYGFHLDSLTQGPRLSADWVADAWVRAEPLGYLIRAQNVRTGELLGAKSGRYVRAFDDVVAQVRARPQRYPR